MSKYPIKVVQFGEGNFLRGFIEWMIQHMNDQGLFQGRVAVCVPIPGKKEEPWKSTDCRYNVVTRGMTDGKAMSSHELITCIDRVIGCYEDFDAFMALAAEPELTLIVSNTTEAGIGYVPEDRPGMRPPSSYPAKLTLFLHARWQKGLPGMVILPCELIEHNGETLKSIVLRYTADWSLEPAFIDWLDQECIFVSSLVDRIVTGFPRDPAVRAELAAEIGYDDPLMDIIEPYHLLVLEPVAANKSKAIQKLQQVLPFTEAGLNVVWTEDLSPYRTRKVRILNGAHTSTSLAALLAGLVTVEDFMNDPDFSSFLAKELYEEILPTIHLPMSEKEAYTAAVLERFRNPYLGHQLSSIALNSVSKWKARLLPTLLDRGADQAPCICFSLAALIQYYLEGNGQDNPEILSFFASLQEHNPSEIIAAVLSRADFWGLDLTQVKGLAPRVAEDLAVIQSRGIRAAVRSLL